MKPGGLGFRGYSIPKLIQEQDKVSKVADSASTVLLSSVQIGSTTFYTDKGVIVSTVPASNGACAAGQYGNVTSGGGRGKDRGAEICIREVG